MAKKSVSTSDIPLPNVLSAIDRKNLDWWETLTAEQQAKFSSWILMRYTSSVQGSAELSGYYLVATNERVNKRFSLLKDHPKLQYLLMTTVSPDMGNQFHPYIAPPKNGKGQIKRRNLIASLFPFANDREIDVLLTINSEADIKKHLENLGWADKDIKKALSGQDSET